MLIPQFTIRRLFGVTAACALLSLFISFAVRGEAWAIGVTVAVGWLVLVFTAFAAVFAVAWLLANILNYKPQDRPLASAIPEQGSVPQLMISEDQE